MLIKPLKVVDTRDIYPPMMIGYAGSLILPLQLGELIRVYLVSRLINVRSAPIFVSIVLERLFDFFTLLLLVIICSFFLETTNNLIQNAILIIVSICGMIFVALAFYMAFTQKFIGIINKLTSILPSNLQQSISENMLAGAEGLRSINDISLILNIFMLSIAQWLFMWACIYLSILAINILVTPFTAFFVLLFVIIGISLPTTPGFIGSIQAAYYLALAPFGVSTEDAFISSVFYHIIAYVCVLIVGIYYIIKYKISYDEIKSNI